MQRYSVYYNPYTIYLVRCVVFEKSAAMLRGLVDDSKTKSQERVSGPACRPEFSVEKTKAAREFLRRGPCRRSPGPPAAKRYPSERRKDPEATTLAGVSRLKPGFMETLVLLMS